MAELSRQLQTVVRDMVTDYMAAVEADTRALLTFQEVVTVALSETVIQGAAIVRDGPDEDGRYWVVVVLTRSNAAARILAAAESGAQRVPGTGAAIRADDRMDRALTRQSMAPVEVAGAD